MKDYAIAKIREEDCIGCMKCIVACPVDAIIGTSKYMHTVIPHECIGCKLCIEPCPMDCIELVTEHKLQYEPSLAKARNKAKKAREKEAVEATLKPTIDDKKSYILEALKRVESKKK